MCEKVDEKRKWKMGIIHHKHQADRKSAVLESTVDNNAYLQRAEPGPGQLGHVTWPCVCLSLFCDDSKALRLSVYTTCTNSAVITGQVSC